MSVESGGVAERITAARKVAQEWWWWVRLTETLQCSDVALSGDAARCTTPAGR